MIRSILLYDRLARTAASILSLAILCGMIVTARAVPPQLSVEPTRELIEFSNNQALFIFDQFMDTSTIHVEWTGIPAEQVSVSWVSIPFTEGAFQMNATFTGPIAADTEVGWTLNPGNSGLMVNLEGEPLAEVSGSFTLPAIGGGGGGNPDCEDELLTEFEPTEGTIIIGRQFNYTQQPDGLLIVDPEEPHTVGISLLANQGQNLTAATLVRPDGENVAMTRFAFPLGPVSFTVGQAAGEDFETPEYTDEAELTADFPSGNYSIQAEGDQPLPNGQVFPLSDPAGIPQPEFANYQEMAGADKAGDWPVSWNALSGLQPTDRLELRVLKIGNFGETTTVYRAPDECNDITLANSDTTHLIPGGVLLPDENYQIELTVIRIDLFDDSEGAAFDAFAGTLRTTTAVFSDNGPVTSLSITEARVEDGQFILVVDGTIADILTTFALERSTSSSMDGWQQVGFISKAVLDFSPTGNYTHEEALSEDQAFFRLVQQ